MKKSEIKDAASAVLIAVVRNIGTRRIVQGSVSEDDVELAKSVCSELERRKVVESGDELLNCCLYS